LKCAALNSGVSKNGCYVVHAAYGLRRAERQKVTERSENNFDHTGTPQARCGGRSRLSKSRRNYSWTPQTMIRRLCAALQFFGTSGASVENEKTTVRAVTSLVTVHLMGAATVCAATSISQIRGGSMKRLLGKLMAMGFLAISLAAFGQSDSGSQDQMKKDDAMKQDTMKKDDMAKDGMKDEMKKDKKAKKSKKDKMKKDGMKKDEMKQDDMKQDDTKKN
jgi:pentapeptide MXKDX repeat protein